MGITRYGGGFRKTSEEVANSNKQTSYGYGSKYQTSKKKEATPEELLEKEEAMQYEGYTTDIVEKASKKMYKKGYGKAYFSVMMAAIPGIAFFIFLSILNLGFGIRFVIPAGVPLVAWLLNVWYTGSLACIPITLFIRWHSYSRLKNDTLTFKKNTIIYHKDKMNEKIGDEIMHLYDEYRLILINPKYEETIGYFKIRGIVEKTEYINGKAKKQEKRSQVNIPKVFEGMDLIHEYAPEPIIEELGKLFEWGLTETEKAAKAEKKRKKKEEEEAIRLAKAASKAARKAEKAEKKK